MAELKQSFEDRRFLSEDPSLSSSLVHFQVSKNLRGFEAKDSKDFWEKFTFFRKKIANKFQKICTLLENM